MGPDVGMFQRGGPVVGGTWAFVHLNSRCVVIAQLNGWNLESFKQYFKQYYPSARYPLTWSNRFSRCAVCHRYINLKDKGKSHYGKTYTFTE